MKSALVTAAWSLGFALSSTTASADATSPDPSAIVHIDGAASLKLEIDTGMVASGRPWAADWKIYKPMCTAPCDAPVPAGQYMLAGPGLMTTPTFTLQGRDPISIEPHMVSFRWLGVGMASTILGGVLLGDGAVFLGAGEAGAGNSPHALVTSGAILLPIGVVLLAVGIPLLASSRSSVRLSTSSAPHDARVRFSAGGLTF